jgi:hypothetical protein
MRMRSKWFGLAGMAVGLALLARSGRVESADHKDAPATIADPASDINDVFTFVDGGRFVMAMTVTPFAGATAAFSDATKYVFHTSSGAAFGTTTTDETFVCTFDAAQNVSCWAGADDYVTGNASSATAPLTSASGRLKIFAGLRADPFFFDLQGFKDAVTAVDSMETALTFDGSGCPAVSAAVSTVLVNTLKETTSTAAATKTVADDFATANTLALVLSVDKSLVTKGGSIVSVWASTNK